MFWGQDQCKFRGSHTTVAVGQRNKSPGIVARQNLISSATDVIVQPTLWKVKLTTERRRDTRWIKKVLPRAFPFPTVH